MIFAAVERETGETVGHAELDRIDPGRSAHVCRVIVAPERRGEGIGTAVMDELRRFAFDELDVARLTLNVYAWNVAAIVSYEKVGFRKRALHGGKAAGDWPYYSMELESGRAVRPSLDRVNVEPRGARKPGASRPNS